MSLRRGAGGQQPTEQGRGDQVLCVLPGELVGWVSYGGRNVRYLNMRLRR